MKGLLTPRQLKQIEQDAYDLYEVLVAKHMWHVIKRRLGSYYGAVDIVSSTKTQVCNEYHVDWMLDCLLCDLHRTAYSVKCGDCILGNCYDSSPYGEVLKGSLLACDEIIEAIEKDAKKRGVYGA